jgi:hypothetical protein
MKWVKKGLIYSPPFDGSWKDNSALQPTAIIINDKIRIYLCLRDDDGIGRIGFIDVDVDNPEKILKISDEPVLDIGSDGNFDDNGVAPTAVIKKDNKIFLYYAGYQLPKKVRFIAFGGLAISLDNGNTFERYSTTPVFERTVEASLFRVPHTVLYDNKRWRFWYGGGNNYIQGTDKTLPVYNIRYLESNSPFSVPNQGREVLDTENDEHRVGRPNVIKTKDSYKMFFGYGSDKNPYQLGYAESLDGIDWVRNDKQLGLKLSETGWDSEMMAYPCVVEYKERTFMFYNGNEYGKYGFGYAELIKK